MIEIEVLAARVQFSRFVKVVESGVENEILIARNGKPAAWLVPLATEPDVGKRL